MLQVAFGGNFLIDGYCLPAEVLAPEEGAFGHHHIGDHDDLLVLKVP